MAKAKLSKIDMGGRGFYSPSNKLNDLTGKEWIKFTKSWFVHDPPRRKEDELLHPSKYPETLVQGFIEFFTKPGQWVLDPMVGIGSTLIACQNSGRNGFGVELNATYAKVAHHRLTTLDFPPHRKQIVKQGDALDLVRLMAEEGLDQVDYCITSPPYWNQLGRHGIRQEDTPKKDLPTTRESDPKDLGSIDSYEQFLEKQTRVFDAVYDVMKPKGYLTVVTNNVFCKGELYPLAFDTLSTLSRRQNRRWVPKDERIWLQDDKRLIALGVNRAYVGNRHHEYCLIFRKE